MICGSQPVKFIFTQISRVRGSLVSPMSEATAPEAIWNVFASCFRTVQGCLIHQSALNIIRNTFTTYCKLRVNYAGLHGR